MAKRGPKTQAGKAVVRLNAVLSQTPLIPVLEAEEEWQTHRTRRAGTSSRTGSSTSWTWA